MYITLIGHEQINAVQNTALLFFPVSRFAPEPCKNTDGRTLESVFKAGERPFASAVINDNGRTASHTEVFDGQGECDTAALVSKAVYRAGQKLTGITPAWGTLTGIRPAKLVKSMLGFGLDRAEIESRLESVYLTSPRKTRLCFDVIEGEAAALRKLEAGTASLYISIPFCPSRCSYCSFVSQSIEKAGKLAESYVELLCREIRLMAKELEKSDVKLNTIYMGGGTPTSLSAAQLHTIMSCVKDSFSFERLLEYTVEAGRPDTITYEKLCIIRDLGAGRISINPQTMSDKTLERIGRRHTAEQTVKAFEIARKVGFKTINADTIAGLPGEDAKDFKSTLNAVLGLGPESVTVHTLSVKRAAFMAADYEQVTKQAEEAAKMLDYSQKTLEMAGYRPYYMYRQKNMAGNLENIGFSKPGHECLYNVYIMGEYQSIVAVGAGAVGKTVELSKNRIERIFNYKYPYEYINCFDKAISNVSKTGFLLNGGRNGKEKD